MPVHSVFFEECLTAHVQPELQHAASALLEIIRQSQIEQVFWVIADATGCMVAGMDRTDQSPLCRALRPGFSLREAAPNAFASCLCTDRPSGIEASGAPLTGLLTLAEPLASGGRVIGVIGCAVPQDAGQPMHLDVVRALLRTAAAACEHVLRAWCSVRELALLKQTMGSTLTDAPVLILDVRGAVQHISSAACDVLGCTRASMIGQMLQTFLPPGAAGRLLCTEAGSRRTGRSLPLTCSFSLGEQFVPVTLLATPVYVTDSEHELLGWQVLLSGAESGGTSSVGAGARSGAVSTSTPGRVPGALAGEELNSSAGRRRAAVGTGTASVQPRYRFSDIICVDPAHVRLIRFAQVVARSASNILITGESGTGKELFAHAIHRGSACAAGPFVPLNCSSLPRDLVETELFGYVEGAFTGARKGGYAGKLLLAEGGTLFLDEIGDMPYELQAKLLRVIQERTVLPVGGSAFLPVHLRLVAATNQELEQRVAAASFRADLYYRLNVVRIQLIPLRARPADIMPLAHHFLSVYAARFQCPATRFTPQAEHQLQAYLWPGNVRELENAIELAVNICEQDAIDVRHLPHLGVPHLTPPVVHIADVASVADQPAPVSVCPPLLSMEDHEQRQIVAALTQSRGNVSDAARVLGIGRTTFYRKLKKYRLEKIVGIDKGMS